MKFKLSVLLLCSMVAFCFTNAKAQTQTFTPSHLQAAERVVDATNIRRTFQKFVDNIIQDEIKNVPDDKRAAFVDSVKKFFDKYTTDEEIKKDFAPDYAAAFSETELNHIADFLATPAGKAMLAKEPMVIIRGLQRTDKIVTGHIDDLKKIIDDFTGTK